MLPDIDFFKIRPFQNSRNKGFEELCVQLFRASFPNKTQFYRVDDAGGDGGVEDIALLDDDRKVGLQAKFFKSMGQSQWSQINKSVKTALHTHRPNIIEYRIACPCNRPKDSKSWDNYCKKWQTYAHEQGYTSKVKFLWKGDSELRNELTKNKHYDKVFYWFGCKQFSDEWLKDKFGVSKKLLDTRYTPEHHVRTESELKLDAFLLTDQFRQAFWKKIRATNSCAVESLDVVKSQNGIEGAKNFAEEIERFKKTFCELYGIPSVSNCHKAIKSLKICTLNIYEKYEELRNEKESKQHSDSKRTISSRPFSYQLNELGKLIGALNDSMAFIKRFSGYDKRMALVLGNAGVGKSHLIAAAVEDSLIHGRPALLLLGEQFLSGNTPLEQICKILGWEDGVEALLGALNSSAAICGKPAIIAIDALNESGDRKLWKSQLFNTISLIERHPNIWLLVSCRSDFASFILPKSISEKNESGWSWINHHGFGEDIFEAITTYFKGYNVSCNHFPPLLEEFRNPLFLKTFCEAFANDTVPQGSLSLDKVMKKRVEKCQELIRDTIDCPEYITKKAIDLISEKIASNQGLAVPYEDLRPEIDNLFPGRGESQSLFTHLRSSGMIVETFSFKDYSDEESELLLRFPYERFSDYFIASRLLERFSTKEELKSAWFVEGLPDKWIEEYSTFFENRGLLRMMSILIPDRFGCEFLELFQTTKAQTELFRDFLTSLPWRNAETFTPISKKLFATCAEHLDYDELIQELIPLLTIPGHPLNSHWLNDQLSKIKLWQLELEWTIPITNITRWGEQDSVNVFLRWAFNVPLHLVSDEQAWLAALFLSWLLSSNYRFLRHRATLALIRMLNGRAHIVNALIEEFHECRDPYITERVYAAACGVALRETNAEALGRLAQTVYIHMFNAANVPPHVLQRDYAQLIIEYANYCNALPNDVDINRCRPIFSSKWPRIISEKRAQEIENLDGWFEIRHSIQPEGSGMYGDFGRYIMDACVHNFSRRTFKQPEIKADTGRNVFSGMMSRRYILQRIKQLGWTKDRFIDNDQKLSHGRMRADEEANKIERIGKKYQWIALHEFLGYLSDRYRMARDFWSKDEPIYKGAWQTGARDFDPTQPLVDPFKKNYLTSDEAQKVETDPSKWRPNYPDPFSDQKLRFDREGWVRTTPHDFSILIEPNRSPNNQIEWLTLSCHYSWNEILTIAQDEKKEGQLKMWADLRCWLIRREDSKTFLQKIKDIRFYGQGCDYVEFYNKWLGEYPWAPSLKEISEYCRSTDDWLSELRDKKISMFQTVCGYNNERSRISARLPSPIVCELLGLKWTGENYDYVDSSDNLLAFCPMETTQSAPLLVRRDIFLETVERSGLVPIWAVLSERSCYSYKKHESIVKKWAITQRVYTVKNEKVVCCIDKQYEIPLYH